MTPDTLLLAGGAEFGGRMSDPDLRALELAGGPDAPVRIIPAAAAPDHNHVRAGENGARWFRGLGARDVQVVYAIDRPSADDPAMAAALADARLVYLLGGFPRHLAETLAGSRLWEAALSAYQAGAVIAGSSAGAMVLCDRYYDPYERLLLPGLGLIPDACVLPHHATMGLRWLPMLSGELPNSLLIGIDESTAMIRERGMWTVYGSGRVALYPPSRGQPRTSITYTSGQCFTLPLKEI